MGFLGNIFGKGKPSNSNEEEINGGNGAPQKVTAYVCPNCGHKSNEPGSCPNCGVPLRREGESVVNNAGGNPQKVSESQGQAPQAVSEPPMPQQVPPEPQVSPQISPQMPQTPPASQTPSQPSPQPEPQPQTPPAPQTPPQSAPQPEPYSVPQTAPASEPEGPQSPEPNSPSVPSHPSAAEEGQGDPASHNN